MEATKPNERTAKGPVDKPRKDPPGKPDESRSDKFRRLAQRRVPVALKRIRHVANLANFAQYEYTPEQRDKIIVALKNAVQELADKFNGRKNETETFTI